MRQGLQSDMRIGRDVRRHVDARWRAIADTASSYALLCALCLGAAGVAAGQASSKPNQTPPTAGKATTAPTQAKPKSGQPSPTPAQAESTEAPAEKGIQAHFQAAQTFQIAGDMERAQAEYRQYVSAALERLGNLKVADGDLAAGSELLQSATAADPKNAEAAIDLGIAYFRNGDLDKAKLAVERVLENDPSNFRARNLLGKVFFMQADFQSATRELQTALSIKSDFDVAYTLALASLKLKNLPQATVLFDEMLGTAKPDPELQMLIGVAYRETGYLDEALGHFASALALDPNHLHAHFALGLTYLMQGEAKYPDARREFETELRFHPADASSHDFLAMLDANQHKAPGDAAHAAPASPSGGAAVATSVGGQADRAGQQELRNMMTKSGSSPAAPNDPKETEYIKSVSLLLGEAYHNLGVMDARAGRFAEASDEFGQAARWNTTIAALDRNWGVAAFRAQRYAEALVPLARQYSRDSSDMTLRAMLGVSYFMLDNFQQCARLLGPVADQLPNNPGLLFAAGVSLVRSGSPREASRVFERMLQLNGESADIHMLLGEAHAEEGEYAPALEEFSRALELNPKLPEAHYRRGKVFFKQGKLDEAARDFQAELTLDPRSVPASYELAYVRLEQHQADEAVRLLNDVLAQKPEYADAHYQMGKALLDKADVKNAIQHLETAVKLDPAADYSYYQLGLAYRRDGRPEDAQKALDTSESLRAKKRTPAPARPEN
jgi:tetratricopeptide (TPR) repeat protein